MNMKLYLIPLFFLILVMPEAVINAQKIKITGLIEQKAMVVCARSEAAEIGLAILKKKGGNAIDAAVAVQFALAVCYPEAGNLGGGGFMVIRLKDSVTTTLDYREKAPFRASRNMFLDSENKVIEGSSQLGQLASGVPGTVDGLLAAHKRFGKLALIDLISPSVVLALNGFAISAQQAESLNANARKLILLNGNKIPYLRKSSWMKGDTLKLPELANTLNLNRKKRAGRFLLRRGS